MNELNRLLDANCNRAGEALRTLEDYARFILDSPAWSERSKRLRHRLAAAKGELERDGCLAGSRDIGGDVGASLKTEAETVRADARAVAAAALRRAAEALRALSEYAKIDHPGLGGEFEAMRYEVYALEPLMLADQRLRERLRRARLHVLVPGAGGMPPDDTASVAGKAVAGGADIVRLRGKNMEDGRFCDLAGKIAEICREGGAVFLVDDRPHIAALTGASGMHGGWDGLPVHLVRRLLGYGRIIGRSASTPELAEKALADGADYIGVGPVFEAGTGVRGETAGLSCVKWAAEWDRLPFFAFGSINRDTIGGVLDAGAPGVAICSAIIGAGDVAGETAFYKRLLTARFRE